MMPPLLRQLFRESLVLPRSAARRILNLAPPPRAALSVALLAIIVSTLFGAAARLVLPPATNPLAEALLDAPLLATALQFGIYLVMAALVAGLGRLAGGRGDLPGALALMAWIQAMLTVLQVGQTAALLLLPALGNVAGVAVMLWFFYALSAFVAELHGFGNVLKVLGGVFISFIAVLLVLAFLVTLMGVPLPEMR
ncbi:hypothetical protein GE300_10085 [Rhodobacteraceae bacterium 2CG4]|uniref:Yip1 domain-containing protein n=1 Tax=Halovulum marinum TaxID=2662447 RepID=A0A6L5Z0A4_9RHOB|nr:YIP1 family protein [Halovulum marinum]MSU89957.1 hypothetical protein [Halovulum marinum]